MTRNWNMVLAKLVDPFKPDWERAGHQMQVMRAEQDARGGHIYPPFRLPDSPLSSRRAPGTRNSSLVQRLGPVLTGPTLAKAGVASAPAPSKHEAGDLQETRTF